MDWSVRLSTAKQNAEESLETNASDAAGAATRLVLVKDQDQIFGFRGSEYKHSYLSVLSDDCWGEDILHSFHGTGGMGPRRVKGGRVNVRLN